MQIDQSLHSVADNYKLLTNLVVPRPIAWVTSVNAGGVVNLAPFSFFNAVGANPLSLTLALSRLRERGVSTRRYSQRSPGFSSKKRGNSVGWPASTFTQSPFL